MTSTGSVPITSETTGATEVTINTQTSPVTPVNNNTFPPNSSSTDLATGPPEQESSVSWEVTTSSTPTDGNDNPGDQERKTDSNNGLGQSGPSADRGRMPGSPEDGGVGTKGIVAIVMGVLLLLALVVIVVLWKKNKRLQRRRTRSEETSPGNEMKDVEVAAMMHKGGPSGSRPSTSTAAIKGSEVSGRRRSTKPRKGKENTSVQKKRTVESLFGYLGGSQREEELQTIAAEPPLDDNGVASLVAALSREMSDHILYNYNRADRETYESQLRNVENNGTLVERLSRQIPRYKTLLVNPSTRPFVIQALISETLLRQEQDIFAFLPSAWRTELTSWSMPERRRLELLQYLDSPEYEKFLSSTVKKVSQYLYDDTSVFETAGNEEDSALRYESICKVVRKVAEFSVVKFKHPAKLVFTWDMEFSVQGKTVSQTIIGKPFYDSHMEVAYGNLEGTVQAVVFPGLRKYGDNHGRSRSTFITLQKARVLLG